MESGGFVLRKLATQERSVIETALGAAGRRHSATQCAEWTLWLRGHGSYMEAGSCALPSGLLLDSFQMKHNHVVGR